MVGYIPDYFIREPSYVPRQQKYPVQVAPTRFKDDGHGQPGDATNGGQTYFFHANSVPVQQSQGVQAAHGQRNIHRQKPDDTNNGGQPYFNGEPSYRLRQQSYHDEFAPVAHRNTRLQKPDDATDRGQRHHQMREPKNGWHT